MAVVDYIILGIIAFSCLISVFRGFIREIFSLSTWIITILASIKFTPFLIAYLPGEISSPTLRLGIAAFLIFVLTFFLCSIINRGLLNFVSNTGLTSADRMLALLFGIMRGVFIVAGFVLVAGLTPIPQENWWRSSILVDYFVKLATWLTPYLPSSVAEYISY